MTSKFRDCVIACDGNISAITENLFVTIEIRACRSG